MAVDAICAFEYLYCGRLRLKRSDDYYTIVDRDDGFNMFSRKVNIKIKLGYEYPCRIELIGPTERIFSCVVEAGDDWTFVWRQLLGSLGSIVEYSNDCEKVLNRLAVKHRMLLGTNPHAYKTLKNKISTLTGDISVLQDHVRELERENQILRRLLAEQILKE
jgi:hypothetical protein